MYLSSSSSSSRGCSSFYSRLELAHTQIQELVVQHLALIEQSLQPLFELMVGFGGQLEGLFWGWGLRLAQLDLLLGQGVVVKLVLGALGFVSLCLLLLAGLFAEDMVFEPDFEVLELAADLLDLLLEVGFALFLGVV